jgi:hypothetical protein
MVYAAGQHANLLGRALSVAMSPAVDALFPVANLYDGRPARPGKHGSNGANPSITFDLAAFTPQGAGTVNITARSGERRRLTSTGTTSITLQNLSTGKFLKPDATWQVASIACMSAAGDLDYQVESYTACQALLVTLKIVITSGTSVADWPRWNALAVFGHNLDPGLTCELRSSTDNFGGSNVLEATGAIVQPGFFMLDAESIANRYGRRALTGTNQATPWYGEVVACWLGTAADAPDIGFELRYEEPQIRNTGPWGEANVYNLAPFPRRVAQMQFDQSDTGGAIETRQEIILRCRGGAYPIVVALVWTEALVLHARPTDKWAETRYISIRWRNDLVLAEDAIAAPLA